MGCCCPFFTAKVSDIPRPEPLEPHTQGQQDSHCRKISQQFQATGQLEIPVVKISNPTEHKTKSQQQINQMQSNLQIALSASNQNEEERSSVAYEPRFQPKMVLFKHSQIRESVCYRWQNPQFVPDELFIPIDLDRIFLRDETPRQEQKSKEVIVQN